ncbi:MAG: hypothetical protein QMD96_06290 [Anaerosomatales bacterium]|nr:hypothetical protein [Anaerosomatales bacterium]
MGTTKRMFVTTKRGDKVPLSRIPPAENPDAARSFFAACEFVLERYGDPVSLPEAAQRLHEPGEMEALVEWVRSAPIREIDDGMLVLSAAEYVEAALDKTCVEQLRHLSRHHARQVVLSIDRAIDWERVRCAADLVAELRKAYVVHAAGAAASALLALSFQFQTVCTCDETEEWLPCSCS